MAMEIRGTNADFGKVVTDGLASEWMKMNDTYQLAGQTVRRIGFGAMQLPGPGVLGPPKDRDEALRVLRRSIELGVNHIDTAQFYGPDVANDLIREALHPYSSELALVSKVGARRSAQGDWLPAQTPAELRSDVEENLRSLRIDQLTVVNLRRHEVEGEANVPLEDQLAEMIALRDEGKIAGIGLSTITLEQLETALAVTEVACVQNAFSLVDQRDTPVLERCLSEGIAYVPYFPLGSAFPHFPKVVDQPAVRVVGERRGISPAQVGLAWLLGKAENVLLIPGTSSLGHLEENMAAAKVELTDEDQAELAKIS